MGPVDVLINCAGYAVCGLFEETKIEDFKVIIIIIIIINILSLLLY